MESYYAIATPGLEPLVAQELNALGLASVKQEIGGASFEGPITDLYRANLWLRTSSRVLVRLGSFHAAAFSELRKKAGRLEWERWLAPGQPIALHVTCHKSRLYHSGGVAERVAGAIGDRLGKLVPFSRSDEDAAGSQPQLVFVRLVNDECTVSLDSSGELLHRRGYRLATAKAPLRETLAAAMLFASGWASALGQSPGYQPALLDPFCGSGTIPIEAALLALNLPPGRSRRFAFMDWPGYNSRQWDALLSEVGVKPGVEFPILQASDRDAGAVQMTKDNASRAGILDAIQISCRAVSAIEPPDGAGWMVTNPPYGLRVSAGKDLRNLYAQLGNVLRQRCPGWRVAVLSSDLRLLAQTGLSLDTSFTTVNGGLKVRLAKGLVPLGESF